MHFEVNPDREHGLPDVGHSLFRHILIFFFWNWRQRKGMNMPQEVNKVIFRITFRTLHTFSLGSLKGAVENVKTFMQ